MDGAVSLAATFSSFVHTSLLMSFLFSSYSDHRDLHSFPTRRSSDLRFEPAHYQDEMKVVVDLLWFESQRDKELRFEAVRLPGCKDSHDRVRLAVQADGLADDFVVTAETLHPKSVSHHHDAIPAHDSFLGENVPPQEKGS